MESKWWAREGKRGRTYEGGRAGEWVGGTHGRRGGHGGGDAPPLASKNISPPLEPKIRNLQKISGQKREEITIFLKKLLDFGVLKVRS